MSWWLQQASGTAATSTVTGYAAGDVLSVTVPARTVESNASWNENASVTIKAGYDAQNGLAAATPVNYTITQSPYTRWITVSNIRDNSVNITMHTNAEWIRVRLNADGPTGPLLTGTPNMVDGQLGWFELARVTSAHTIILVNDITGNEVGRFEQPAADGYFWNETTACPAGYAAETQPTPGMKISYMNGEPFWWVGTYVIGSTTYGGENYWRHITTSGGKIETRYEHVNDLGSNPGMRYILCKVTYNY
jgi:hypothetical protein